MLNVVFSRVIIKRKKKQFDYHCKRREQGNPVDNNFL